MKRSNGKSRENAKSDNFSREIETVRESNENARNPKLRNRYEELSLTESSVNLKSRGKNQ